MQQRGEECTEDAENSGCLQRLHRSCRECSLLAGIPSWLWKLSERVLFSMGRADGIPELNFRGELAGMALGGAISISHEHMLHPWGYSTFISTLGIRLFQLGPNSNSKMVDSFGA